MRAGVIWWIVTLATCVAGGLLVAVSGRLLGRVRAAANWPTAPPVGRGGRVPAFAGAAVGLVLLAGAAALTTLQFTRPAHLVGWLPPAGAAVVVLVAGGFAAGKEAERAELTALIRTPPAAKWIPAQDQVQDRISTGVDSTLVGDSDPAVPPGGEPGWVYRDPAGAWYLAVATDQGHRLVSLPGFTLVPAGGVAGPLDLAGSVQISVYPVADPPPHAGRPAGQVRGRA